MLEKVKVGDDVCEECLGLGYKVFATEDGRMVTWTCPKCKGTGFIREDELELDAND